jgi:hypothetical protein
VDDVDGKPKASMLGWVGGKSQLASTSSGRQTLAFVMDVSVIVTNDVWAVGAIELARLGVARTEVPSPTGSGLMQLLGVSAGNSNDDWVVVGEVQGFYRQPWALYGTGNGWEKAKARYEKATGQTFAKLLQREDV